MLTALMTSVVIPWGDTLEIAGRQVSLQVSDLNIGVLYVFGVVSLEKTRSYFSVLGFLFME
jgi:NADH-quinone oxidoreductase subunit H